MEIASHHQCDGAAQRGISPKSEDARLVAQRPGSRAVAVRVDHQWSDPHAANRRMERSKTSEAVEGRLMGGYLGLGRFEIVRYKAIVEEIFQAWISKIRISTTTAGAASR